MNMLFDLKFVLGWLNIFEGMCIVFDCLVRFRFNVFFYDELFLVIDVYWIKNRKKLDILICDGKYLEKNNDGKLLIIKNVIESDVGRY